MKRLFIAALAIVAMSSCAKSDGGAEGDKSLAATFNSTVVSRVDGTTWESTDEVGIVVIDKEGEVSDNHPFNARHTVSTTGVFTPYDETHTIYYLVDPLDYIDFYAYYPYDDGVEEDMMHSLDVSEQSVPTEIDFMEAYTNDRYTCENDSAVQLTFKRRLTKFTINLIAGDGFYLSDVTGVRFEGFYTTADYDLMDSGFSDLGGVENIASYKEDGDTYSAILIPMKDHETLYDLDETHKVVVSTVMGDIVWELYDSENDGDKDVVLEAGSEHIFDVTISREDLGAAGEIQEWDEVDRSDSSLTTDN